MIGLAFLIAVPLIELIVLVKAGGAMGFWPLLAWILATFLLGSAVIARSGIASALRMREAMQQGEPLVLPMVENALMVFAGVLLMTPGLIADACGLALLVPPLRTLAARFLMRNMIVFGGPIPGTRSAGDGRRQPPPHDGAGPRGGPRPSPRPEAGGPVIEGEFERIDERPIDGRRGPEPGPDERR